MKSRVPPSPRAKEVTASTSWWEGHSSGREGGTRTGVTTQSAMMTEAGSQEGSQLRHLNGVFSRRPPRN
eukprot:3694369-Amphidinium_carterae.1